MEQLTGTLLSVLEQEGLSVCRRFPGGLMPRLTGARTAAQVRSFRVEPCGLGHYLGLSRDGSVATERYAKRVGGTLLLRTFAPDVDVASAEQERILQALSRGIPGLSIRSFQGEETEFSSLCDCYTKDLLVEFSAYYYARENGEEDAPLFLDFTLEGELQ